MPDPNKAIAKASKVAAKPMLPKHFRKNLKEQLSKRDQLDKRNGEVRKMEKTLKTADTLAYKPSVIAIFNGGEGSGKSTAAYRFPKPFIIELESKKILETIHYNPLFSHFKEDLDYVIGIVLKDNGDVDWLETEKRIEYFLNDFRETSYQNYETLVIDVGKAIRDASVRAEELRKGRGLGQFEYIPITKSEKALMIPLINRCRNEGVNLIIVTHWEGIYETRKNAQGFDENVQVGKQPDLKGWMRDLVSWRIDFLKPQESGFENKFICDFQKAPGSQYFQIDITGKSLFDILSDPAALEAAKEDYHKLIRMRIAEQKEKEAT